MRYVTLRIRCEDGVVHAIAREDLPPSVGRGPIHRIELLDDGSIVLLRAVVGDVWAYEEAMAAHPAVDAVSITDGGHAFVHLEPTDCARRILRWVREFPVLLRVPIEFDGEDPILTLVGAVADFTDATASLPAPLTFDVLETGRYAPAPAVPFHGLTDRQREVLTTAVDLGYYENPRAATQAEVGAALSLAPGTVGDHLRTIEAHVFSSRSGLSSGRRSRS